MHRTASIAVPSGAFQTTSADEPATERTYSVPAWASEASTWSVPLPTIAIWQVELEHLSLGPVGQEGQA